MVPPPCLLTLLTLLGAKVKWAKGAGGYLFFDQIKTNVIEAGLFLGGGRRVIVQ